MEDLETYQVRNCSELVPTLHYWNPSNASITAPQKLFKYQNPHFPTSEVDSLSQHDETLGSVAEEVVAAVAQPVSEIDAVQSAEFLSTIKDRIKYVELDIKDGKRRVSSAKGPPQKRPKSDKVKEESDSEAEPNLGDQW